MDVCMAVPERSFTLYVLIPMTGRGLRVRPTKSLDNWGVIELLGFGDVGSLSACLEKISIGAGSDLSCLVEVDVDSSLAVLALFSMAAG